MHTRFTLTSQDGAVLQVSPALCRPCMLSKNTLYSKLCRKGPPAQNVEGKEGSATLFLSSSCRPMLSSGKGLRLCVCRVRRHFLLFLTLGLFSEKAQCCFSPTAQPHARPAVHPEFVCVYVIVSGGLCENVLFTPCAEICACHTHTGWW